MMNPVRTLFPLVVLLAAVARAQAPGPALVTGPGGISITAEEVLADALTRLPPDVRAQALKDPRNISTLAQEIALRRAMAAQAVESGLDKDPDVVTKLRLARERVLTDARLAQLEKQAPDKAVLEKVALAEYRTQTDKFVIPEQVRVRHILIDARSCEAEKRIAEILEKAKVSNADFAALATAHSDDPGSAKQGGDLGFFERGRMVPEFEKAAFALSRPGELSGVVRTKFGFHILRLEERRPAGREPFEKVRAGIIQDIERREQRTRRAQLTDPITESLRLDPAAIEALSKRAP